MIVVVLAAAAAVAAAIAGLVSDMFELYRTGSICVCRHGIDTDDCGEWDCVNRPLAADEGGTA